MQSKYGKQFLGSMHLKYCTQFWGLDCFGGLRGHSPLNGPCTWVTVPLDGPLCVGSGCGHCLRCCVSGAGIDFSFRLASGLGFLWFPLAFANHQSLRSHPKLPRPIHRPSWETDLASSTVIGLWLLAREHSPLEASKVQKEPDCFGHSIWAVSKVPRSNKQQYMT